MFAGCECRRNSFDPHGDPMGSHMHIVERWKLLDRGALQIRWTFDDPDDYTHPWNSKPFVWKRKPNIRMAEMSCTENNIYDPTNPANGYSPDRPEVRALQLVATNEHFALIDKSALATLAIQAASQITYALMHPGSGSVALDVMV